MSNYSYVGKSIPVPGGREKVEGKATFAGDMSLPNMLHGKILHSPLAHARILNIDASRALKHHGVKAVVTSADAPGFKTGRYYKDRPVLATGEVHFIGEPVAALAAVDEETALEALDLIRVDYDELPAVFDPLLAMKPDSPLVHHDVDSFEPQPPKRNGLGNILDQTYIKRGDADKALRESYLVHHDTYRTSAQNPGYIEPTAILASVDSYGKATLWSSTKSPHVIRADLERLLSIPLSKLRVIAPEVGGDFGGKGGITIQPACLLLALKAKQPVRMVLDRREELMCAFSREATISELSVGVKRDGTITAIKGHIIFESGAYCDTVTRVYASNLLGPYLYPNIDLTAYLVYTNNTPRGQVRAPRFPAPIFASESHLDMVAKKLGMDPLEFRLKNAIEEGYEMPGGHDYMGTTGFRETVKEAVEYLKRQGSSREKNRGWGISCAQWGAHSWTPVSQPSSAWVKLNVDGSATLISGVTDQGGGQYGMLSQIVAEILSIPFKSVNVVAADTETTPYEQGTGGSNTTYRVGNSVKWAAEDVRGKILQFASAKLEAPSQELELKDSRVFLKGRPDRSISLAAIASEAMSSRTGPIFSTGEKQREKVVAAQAERKGEIDRGACAAHVAQVEVDPETGQVKVLKYFAAHDAGCAINPANVRKQIEGGVTFGLGYALTEETRLEQGKTLSDNFGDYKLQGITTVPDIESAIIEVPSRFGPFGARGVGEPPNVLVAPAIANAVYDAIGVRITHLPITPERVRMAIKSQNSGV